jgi:pimeloyl-ACP methyl ester carboxylesterase
MRSKALTRARAASRSRVRRAIISSFFMDASLALVANCRGGQPTKLKIGGLAFLCQVNIPKLNICISRVLSHPCGAKAAGAGSRISVGGHRPILACDLRYLDQSRAATSPADIVDARRALEFIERGLNLLEASMVRLFKTIALLMLFLLPADLAAAEERWQTLPEPGVLPAPTESGYAPVNGIQMYYAVFGAGDPILLIHGGLGHADIWANQVLEMSKTHKVIVADSRGHGRSTRTEEPYGYDLMASDYLALLDFLKVDKTALIGWSDGGIIGIDIAMTHPGRLTRLYAQAANVTVDGVDPGVATDPTFGAYIKRMGEDYRKMSKTPDQYDAFVKQISHMWETQPNWSKEQLAKITTPSAIVAGDHDEAIKREHTEYMASVIPGAKLIILPNASHFAMLQAPDEYTKSALEFIEAK